MKKSIQDLLEKHKALFEALAPIDVLEYDVAQYVVANKQSFIDKLKPYQKSHTDLFPSDLYDIYLEQYRDKAYEIILDDVSLAFNLDPENRLRVSKELISNIAGDLLVPTKEKK